MRAFALAAFIALAACDRGGVPRVTALDSGAENKTVGAIDRTALDSNVAPCTDFYAYACGGWIQSRPIPEDEGMWSRSFHEITLRNEIELRAILEGDATRPPANEPQSNALGDFYATCSDQTAIAARGNHELIALLDTVDTSDADHAAATSAHLRRLGIASFFAFEPEPDLNDARLAGAVLRQPPLTLSEERYGEAAERAALVSHVTKMFELVGDSQARAVVEAADAADVEQKLVGAFESRAVFHDSTSDPLIADGISLPRIAAKFPWNSYFKTLAVDPPLATHVATPHYLTALGNLFAQMLQTTRQREALRSLFRWQLLRTFGPLVSSALAAEDFTFTRRLTGATKIAPRWKQCVRAAEATFADALSVPFAKRMLDARAADRARIVGDSMQHAMHDEIAALPWMDVATRATALAKLDRVAIEIGTAETRVDYPVLVLGRTSFLSNLVRTREFAANRELMSMRVGSSRLSR
ncbi:MAG: M13 family metallopeptidase N-terminal domain-containing protein, partial [Polyangiaceae bacterium]